MKTLLSGIFLLLACPIFSQSYEAGVWAGGINSFNDINTNSSVFDVRPSGGIVAKYNFDSRIGAGINVSYGRAFTTDEKRAETNFQQLRNEAARTTTFSASAKGEFNFFDFNATDAFLDPQIYTPYLTAGIGYTNIKPELFLRSQGWTDVSSLQTEDEKDFSASQINIPLGGGVKYQLSDDFVLSGEWVTNVLFTDYYEDISTVYNTLSLDENIGLIDQVNRQRGDRFKNDSYNLFGLQLTYVIPIYRCPGE
ncbi:MAG: porin family protein [Saprospiraceae bacterium]|nr:porin family protein [Saprospiraceae bacterium]